MCVHLTALQAWPAKRSWSCCQWTTHCNPAPINSPFLLRRPAGLARQEELELLLVDHNQLSGVLPTYWEAPQLARLDLQHNNFSGAPAPLLLLGLPRCCRRCCCWARPAAAAAAGPALLLPGLPCCCRTSWIVAAGPALLLPN